MNLIILIWKNLKNLYDVTDLMISIVFFQHLNTTQNCENSLYFCWISFP